ncbi:MAG: hypothetical protein Q9212_007235 [Teloschistes hypoglaucus]
MDLPKDIEELVEKHTLADDVEIDDPNCPVCLLPYSSQSSSELPLKIPGCSHIMGGRCLATWLAGSNSCPLCRTPVLAIATHRGRFFEVSTAELEAINRGDFAQGPYWRFRLAAWSIPRDYITPPFFCMFSPFESSFWQLCEAVISVMPLRRPSAAARHIPDFIHSNHHGTKYVLDDLSLAHTEKVRNLRLGDRRPEMDPQSSSTTTLESRRPLQVHSCVICQRRKVKCDRSDPCSNCVKHRVQCEYRSPAPPKRRKRASPDPDVHAKLKRYENILQRHGVNPEEVYDKPLPARPDYPLALARAKETNNTSDSAHETPQHSSTFKHLEELLEGSDDESRKPGPGVIQKAYDKLHADGSGLLFGFSVKDELKSLHPQPINIFRLWQTYLNSVYPLSMLFHAPTVQQQILDASANLDNVSETMEALMFAIYYAAVVALTAEDCEAMFGLSQSVVVNKYMLATQQALNAAKLLKNMNMTVLQALVIFLTASRHSIDPRSLWIHCGTAVRLGQRIGLHRDGTTVGLSPFDTEMRRRLWWQIVLLDSRVAELSGAGTSVLSTPFDTFLPSNVNDSNLLPEMGEMPPEQKGASDMIFCLTRCEIANFMKQSNTTFFFDGAWARSDGAPASLAEKDAAIDELEDHLERKYLRHCDPQITLHFLTKIFTRTALWRMRLVAHHPRHYPDRGASMPAAEKDLLCRLSLNMIENDNIAHRNRSADRFAWFVNTNFQLPAFIYLLSELRHRTRGELSDRGWDAIAEGFRNRIDFIAERKHSPVFQATSALALKAWQAREMDALAHGEPGLQQPEYITTLKGIVGNPTPQPKNKHQRRFEDNKHEYMHTPTDSTIGDSSSFQQGTPSNGSTTATTAPPPPPQARALGQEPTEWSPIDWMYWDELIQNWEPGINADGSGELDFNFGGGFHVG